MIRALDACEEAIGIYIFSDIQWKLHNESNVKHESLINNLTVLEKSLNKLNIPLIAINTNEYQSLPSDLCMLSKHHQIQHVFWNNEFGLNESKRDIQTAKTLLNEGIRVLTYHDQVVYESGFLKTDQGKPFSVFTPFIKEMGWKFLY